MNYFSKEYICLHVLLKVFTGNNMLSNGHITLW